jgi:tRNA threonylcarbamoyladenosine biosynthesis protein TsaB
MAQTGSSAPPSILAFDTAGSAASVAVARGEHLLAHHRLALLHGHAEALMPLIDRLMRESALSPSALDLVAVTVGPGGFTGIRVGLAAARGIALATGAALLGLSGFEAVAASFPFGEPRGGEPHFLVVALESRREDLYVALFNKGGEPGLAPVSVMPDALAAALGTAALEKGLVVAGDAAHRAAAALPRASVRRVEAERVPDAIGVARAAYRSWLEGVRENAAQPLYLRPPDVTFPTARRSPR